MSKRLSAVLSEVYPGHVGFYCPGCKLEHNIRVKALVDGHGPVWGYNGNPEKPTFTPSILVRYNGRDAGIDDAPPAVCHTFVTDGHIQFLPDCMHWLAGKTVNMVDMDS